jgi:hypothetical protein
VVDGLVVLMVSGSGEICVRWLAFDTLAGDSRADYCSCVWRLAVGHVDDGGVSLLRDFNYVRPTQGIRKKKRKISQRNQHSHLTRLPTPDSRLPPWLHPRSPLLPFVAAPPPAAAPPTGPFPRQCGIHPRLQSPSRPAARTTGPGLARSSNHAAALLAGARVRRARLPVFARACPWSRKPTKTSSRCRRWLSPRIASSSDLTRPVRPLPAGCSPTGMVSPLSSLVFTVLCSAAGQTHRLFPQPSVGSGGVLDVM